VRTIPTLLRPFARLFVEKKWLSCCSFAHHDQHSPDFSKLLLYVFLFFQAPIFVNAFVFQAVFFSSGTFTKLKLFCGARLLRVQQPPNRLGEVAW